MKRSFSSKLSHLIAKFPWLWLIFSLILIGIIVPQLKYLQADFSYRIWFRTTDPLIKTFDEFERRFGNDDTVVILMHSPSGVFDKESIETIKSITQDMWQVQDIIRVDSLTNYQWTHATGDEIIIEDFIPENYSAKDLQARKKIALKHEVIPDYLIDKKANIAIVYAKVRPYPGGSPNDLLLIQNSRKVIEKYQGKSDHTFYINGSTAINNTFKEVSESDLSTMIPIVLLLIIIFLIFMFKNISGILIPFSIIITTLICTFGFSAFIGIKFNNMITIIPNIIIAIAIADTVHILVTYFQFRKDGLAYKEAMIKTYEKNISPTFLTSISTSIGFLSFAAADLIPLAHLGILASFGTMLAWILTMTLVGPILALINIKLPKATKKEAKNNSALRIARATRLYSFIEKFRMPIVITFTALFIGSIWLAFQNEVNSNPYTYFSKSVPLRKANDFGLKEMGGVTGPEIILDSGQIDGIKEPIFLRKVQSFQSWLEQENYISRVISMINIIKSMNRSFNGDIQDYYRIPDTKEKIAELLFLYTMSLPQGLDLNDRMTLDNRSLRLTALWSSQDSKRSLANIEKMKNKAKELGLDATITGKIPIYQGMNDLVVSTFFTSITIAICGITLLLVFVFGSLKIGLMSMLPNIVPLGFGAALMTLLDKPIDVGTALVTSVCLGIVVDDTIHFLSNYYTHVKNGKTPKEAIIYVLANTGPALIVTTVILMVGFGALAFAKFIPNVNFGILSATVLGIALVVDLIYLPAIILTTTKGKN